MTGPGRDDAVSTERQQQQHGTLGADLASALQEFSARESILVALDFDGVMSELVDRAENARPLPANANALAALAELPGLHTALVSGRALESLLAVASPPESTLLVGSHGAERRLGPEAPPLELDEGQARALAAVGQVLEPIAARYPDSWVEHKPAAQVLQVRLAQSVESAQQAVVEAEEALRELAGRAGQSALGGLAPFFIGHGKDVLEVAVVRTDKGEGLDLLRSVTGAEAILFAGDDVTDETGFARLDPVRDVSIKVGPGETDARFRIGGPADVATVLAAVRSWRP